MKKLKMLVGLPRSGKSTWAENNKVDTDVVISADRLRRLIHGKRFDANEEAYVWQVREYILKTILDQGHDIIIDETNLTKKRRQKTLRLAKEKGYHIQAYVFYGIPIEELHRRAIETDQENLIHIIDLMSESYVLPSYEEGFDEIFFVNGEKNVE
jgi:predicted kinase